MTAITISSRPSTFSWLGGDGDGALFGELVGVAHEVQQRLPKPHLVGMHHPDRGVAMDRHLFRVALATADRIIRPRAALILRTVPPLTGGGRIRPLSGLPILAAITGPGRQTVARRSRSRGNAQLSQGRALSHRAAGPCATLGCLWAFSWG